MTTTPKIKWTKHEGDDHGAWHTRDGRFEIFPVYWGRVTATGYELHDGRTGRKHSTNTVREAKAKAARILMMEAKDADERAKADERPVSVADIVRGDGARVPSRADVLKNVEVVNPAAVMPTADDTTPPDFDSLRLTGRRRRDGWIPATASNGRKYEVFMGKTLDGEFQIIQVRTSEHGEWWFPWDDGPIVPGYDPQGGNQ